jgi:hypothetical protein
MTTHLVSTGSIAYPNDLALLKRVFDRVCMEQGFPGGSPEAAELAARSMDLFSQGIFGEAELLHSLRHEV